MALHIVDICSAVRFDINVLFIASGLSHFETFDICDHRITQNIGGRLLISFPLVFLSVLENPTVF